MPPPSDDSTPARGFILQATYRTLRGRAVVYLHGVLEGGGTFLIRDGRLAPYVYVREDDLDRAGPLLGDEVARVVPAGETARRTLDGEPVVRLELRHPGDAPELRGRLLGAGVVPYEADVRFAQRYLIDRGIRSSLVIDGPWRKGPGGVDRVYDDPVLSSPGGDPFVPELSVLSFDIETDPRSRVLSVALHGARGAEAAQAAEVWIVRTGGDPGVVEPKDAEELGGTLHQVASEGELLDAFARRVREIDPDVLSGWNVFDFDLAVLLRAAERLGTRLEIGRGPGRTTVRSRGDDDWRRAGPSSATVPGRLVLDGIQMLQGAHVRMESYSLEAVSREVLGRGKVDLEAAAVSAEGAGEDDDEVDDDPLASFDKGAEIVRLWREEPGRLARYNLEDARLVSEILGELQLVELAVERSALVGLPPDRLSASVAAFDFVYLSELGRRGRVAPSVGAVPHDGSTTGGGAVYEPVPGLWEQVAVLDFKSLYPSLIRTFGLDPLLHVADPPPDADTRDDLLVAPNGAVFERPGGSGDDGGILPALLDELFPRREAAKERGDRVGSYAIKILMNSFYGVLGTSACRFYDPGLANAITSFGRAVLAEARRRAEAAGFQVLYGDTDSLFVATGAGDPQEARRVAAELAARLDSELGRWIGERWGTPSRLELELDDIYSKLLLPEARSGGGVGARKRYAGRRVASDGSESTVFVGLEAVRRDWTALARDLQRQLYERLFTDQPVEPYLRQVLEELRAGRHDEALVYRKRLRKHPREYTATTPPHVAAARKLLASRRERGEKNPRPPRTVEYVLTVAGPEPAVLARSPLDHEHYVDKQVRPVAEPVLELLGIDFDAVAGRGEQLGLFG